MKTAEEIKLNLSEKIWLFKDGTISHSECLSAILQAIQSPAPVMSAEQYSSGAIHSIGKFPLSAMSAEQMEKP